jgi:hypothetical protein
MSEPQQTPWRIEAWAGRIYDADGYEIEMDSANVTFIADCVNQHNELLAEIARLRDKVAELESLFPKMGK